MLFLSSCTEAHSTAPFFFTVAKGVTSFQSFVRRQFSLDKYEILQPIRADSALYSGIRNSLELAVEQEV